jgi:hypothetical protein
MHVAHTILQHLGGRYFLAMTGASQLLAGPEYLQFSLPGRLKNRANKCRVTLNGKDLYNLTFYRFNRKTLACPIVGEEADLSWDQLQTLFTKHTGLFTRL